MKKLSYLLGLLLIAGMVFTSCNKDEDEEPQDLTPAITFQSGGDFTSSDVTIDQGDTINVGVICTSNGISGKKLESFKIYMIVNDVTQPNIVDSTDIDAAAFTAGYSISFPDVLDGKLYAEITDKDGQKKSVFFNVTVEEATTPLDGAEDLEWKREYGNDGTGLDMFGLKWTWNGKAVYAKIEKDSADIFVQLTADQWTSITTKEDLAIAVDDATDMDLYEGVNTTLASEDYDDVLATKYKGEYFIIHIEHSTAVEDATGWIFTITGQYNK